VKRFIDNVTFMSFVLLIILLNVTGLWFLQGGDLSDLLNGCFDARGCN